MEQAERLFNDAINLPFLDRFSLATYATEIGLAPTILPVGKNGLDMMTEAANLGYSKAQYQLALYYLFERTHREVVYEQIADFQTRYKEQQNLEKHDSDLGLMWLRKAAEQNYGEALLLLGDLSSTIFFCGGLGRGMKKDDIIAADFYLRGATAGNPDAMYRTGCCYYYGYGVAEDNNSAFSWLCRARDAGCKLMWAQLGECYMNGYGTGEDIPKAIQALERALKDKRFRDSCSFKLAFIYQGNRGFRYADFDKAREYATLISADSEEYTHAQNLLAEMTEAKEQYRAWKNASEHNETSGGCYVATAVYGSYDCPQVWTLRRFRDDTLAKTWCGRAFIRVYYAISPTLVKWFGKTEWFRNLWQPTLDCMVDHLNESGVEDTPYDDRVW